MVTFTGGVFERNEVGGELVHAKEAALEFLIAHQLFAKAVKPAVRHANHPAYGLFVKIAFQFARVMSATLDIRGLGVLLDEGSCWRHRVASIFTFFAALPLCAGSAGV